MNKAVVIGDIMIDKYVFGSISRLNPEDHAVPLVAVDREEYRLGGAANVAANLVSMGIRTHLVGVLGQDDAGKKVQQLAKSLGIELHAVLHENPTIIKERFMAGDRLLLRADREKFNALSDEQIDQIVALSTCQQNDIVVFSDYGKGIANTDLIHQLKIYSKEHNIPIIADSKPVNINKFQGIDIIKPNFLEFKGLVGRMDMEPTDLALIEQYGVTKAAELKSVLVITRGAHGASIITPQGQVTHLPALVTQSIDPTGAGDSFLAGLVTGLIEKKPLVEAVSIGMKAGSIAVSKAGTSIVTRDDIM